MKEITLKIEDIMLPSLTLPDPCSVRIEIRDDYKGRSNLFLYVGQRDWQWDLETGEWIGSGVNLLPESHLRKVMEVREVVEAGSVATGRLGK